MQYRKWEINFYVQFIHIAYFDTDRNNRMTW